MNQNFESLISEGVKIIDAAKKEGVTLRLMGGAAIRMNAKEALGLYKRLGRRPGDLDFAGLKSQSGAVKKVMTALGYEPNKQFNAYHGNKRQLWYSSRNQIDILLDVFEMCHVIDLRKRLTLRDLTLTRTDLFLQKIQNVELDKKDVQDLFILLIDLGRDDDDRIDVDYLSLLLGNDWGFWYTTCTNLRKINGFLPEFVELNSWEIERISTQMKDLMNLMESMPKSLKWKMRAKIGTKARWYNVVEEVVRS
jgi:hypothetical protein